MKLSSREAALAAGTGFILLFGLTYVVGAPRIKVWQERIATGQTQAQRIELSEALTRNRVHWDQRLAEVRGRLSRYPAATDVTADYLKILERVAKENNITLIQRKPQKEKRQGDCYEMPIECTWEGELNGLVRFLFALDQESVTMDVEELSVSLVSGGKGRLKGNFTLMGIYTREGDKAPALSTNAPAKSAAGSELAITPAM
ncbi:MAG: hypothetical protein HYV35_02555 [Lentisphaerae bacterium]|nr:hypothetical protein [Lentisphaerota bacterium]